MNVLALLKSLAARASHLEEEAKLLRADANQIRALLFGSAEVAETPEDPEVVTPTKAAPKMPSRDEILDKAIQYGVDVDDLLPKGKRPTLQQKQDAMKRIYKAKKAAEAADEGVKGVAPAVDLSDVA